MAGENASEFTSDPPGSTSSSSSQMNSPSSNSRPGSSRQGDRRRSLMVRDAEMLNKKPFYRQSMDYTEYEAPALATNNGQPHIMSNLSLRRHSTYSCHSSSSSGDSRPSSSSRKAARDNHLPRPNSWQTSTPREHLQRRQTTCLPSTANSHSEDSADDTSPRQLLNKSSLSKYKPLPAIRGKNHGTSSPDIFKIPTDSQTEEIASDTKNNSSLHSPKSHSLGLKRELSQLLDHPKEADKILLDVRLDLKGSSPDPIQDEDRKPPSPQLGQNHDDLMSVPKYPPNPTSSPPELPGLTDLPTEPGPEEARTELAVKLPNGKRIHRFFRLTDPLRVVRRFAEVSSNVDFSNFQLVKSVPRDILDLEQSIEENQVSGKILLHLERTLEN